MAFAFGVFNPFCPSGIRYDYMSSRISRPLNYQSANPNGFDLDRYIHQANLGGMQRREITLANI